MSKPLLTLIVATSLALSSCSILRTYRGDISQGNVITPKMVNSLHHGESRWDIEHRFGKPVMSQPLNTHTVAYVYRFQPGYGKATQKTLTLNFDRHQRLVSYKVSS